MVLSIEKQQQLNSKEINKEKKEIICIGYFMESNGFVNFPYLIRFHASVFLLFLFHLCVFTCTLCWRHKFFFKLSLYMSSLSHNKSVDDSAAVGKWETLFVFFSLLLKCSANKIDFRINFHKKKNLKKVWEKNSNPDRVLTTKETFVCFQLSTKKPIFLF